MDKLLAQLAALTAQIEAKLGENGEVPVEFTSLKADLATLKAEAKLAVTTEKFSALETKFSDFVAKSKSLGIGSTPKPVETLGTKFTTNPSYKTNVANGQNTKLTFATISSQGLSGSLLGNTDDLVKPIAKVRQRVKDVLDVLPAEGGVIHSTVQTGFVNRAAIVAEGGTVSESDFVYDATQATVEDIQTIIPINKKAYNNAPVLASIIEDDLKYAVESAEDKAIVDTLLETVGIQTYDANAVGVKAEDTDVDAVRHAITKSYVAELPPTVLLLNPIDYARIELSKGTDGHYILINMGGTDELWKVPVTITNQIAVGTFLVGAGKAANYWEGSEFVIEVTDSHKDYFATNLLALKGTVQGVTTVKRPEAWVKGTFKTAA